MKIRLWRLGSLEHGILPNKECLEKFRDTLTKMIESGGSDLVWGPEVSVELIEIDENIENYVLNDGKLEKL